MAGTTKSMLGQPAGWYQDPAPRNPAEPDTVRYWDGLSWTGQVRLASKKVRQEWRLQIEAENRAYVRDLVRRAEAGDVEAQQILDGPPRGEGTRNKTPDGRVVSGWWRRVFAELIDSFLISMLGTLLSWPWLRQLFDIMSAYANRAVSAAQAGLEPPPTNGLVSEMMQPLLFIVAVYFLIGLLYEVGFLKGFNATPGKMLLGLEVHLREESGDLPWGTLLVRWFAKRGYTILNLIPLAVLVTGIYGLLDYLWPLWDTKRQALHDKMAKTNVVRR